MHIYPWFRKNPKISILKTKPPIINNYTVEQANLVKLNPNNHPHQAAITITVKITDKKINPDKNKYKQIKARKYYNSRAVYL